MSVLAVSSTSPLQTDDVRDVSRAIALARQGFATWERVFAAMDSLVGWETAGRWLTTEMEIAGALAPIRERSETERRRKGQLRRLRPAE